MADFQKEHENMDGKDENTDGNDENMDGKDESMDGKYNNMDRNVNGVLHRVVFAVRYAIDVSNRAIHLLSYLISALLYVWLLGFIILHLSHTLRSALVPPCTIPGISSSSICRWDPQTQDQRTVQWADYPHLVETQSKMFEQLMEKSVGNSALSLEVKKSEVATRDLVTLVQISNLKAKNSLATSLVEFLDDAKKTSRRLHKLSSKVGGAVDRYVALKIDFSLSLIITSIMAVNDYALQSINSAQRKPSAWSLSSLRIWRPPPESTNDVVKETFKETMYTLTASVERLILEAEVNLQNLNRLEERLESMHGLVSGENISMSSFKSNLLAELWIKLGSTRRNCRTSTAI